MSGFSNEWNAVYQENLQITSWPWSDLISLIYRHCKDIIEQRGAVFELGCGAGPNIPFIQSLGMDYYGVEGSPTVVNSLHEKFPELKNRVVVGDFTDHKCYINLPNIDIVIDRAAVTHNNLYAIKCTLENSFNIMRSGGYFIGIDWFSTRTDIESGQFSNIGNVHFSDEQHLRSLFFEFDIISLEEKVINSYEPQDKHQFSSWNIVAKKR